MPSHRNASRASIFVGAGYPVLAFAFVEGFEHYHQFTDSPEHLDARSLAHSGSLALTLAREFGNAKRLPVASVDAVYFEIFGRRLLTYPTSFAKLLGTVIALAWLALNRRELTARRVTGRGIARGAQLQLFAVGMALIVPVMLHLLRSLIASPQSLVRNSPAFGWADFLVVAALNLLFYGVGWRRFTVRELVLGGLCVPALLSVLLGWLVPDASAPWQWVTATMLLVWTAEPALSPQRQASRIAWLYWPLFVAVLLFCPLVSSAIAAAGPLLMPIPMLIAATLMGIFLPTLMHKELGRLHLVSGAVGIVGFALMVSIALWPGTVRTNSHDQALVYAYDSDTKLARFASEILNNEGEANPRLHRDSVTQPLLGFSSSGEPWQQMAAPSYPLQPAQVAVRQLPSANPQKLVEIRVMSSEPTRCLRLWQQAGLAVKTLSVDHKPVAQFVRFSPEFDELGMQLFAGLRGHRGWNLRYCGLGAEPLVIELQVSRQPGVKLRLVEERESFPEPIRQLSPNTLVSEINAGTQETWVGRDIVL